MGYCDQTDRHDSPTNAFDIGTLLILFVHHVQVLVPVWIEQREVGQLILLVHKNTKVAKSLFFLCLLWGTLNATVGVMHF